AAGRKIPEIATALGADYLIYQEVADMQAALLAGSDIQALEMSCFTGDYVTRTVTDEYLAWVESNQASWPASCSPSDTSSCATVTVRARRVETTSSTIATTPP